MTPTEIRAACTALSATDAAFAALVAARSDVDVADSLNASLKRTKVVPTLGGIGLVLRTLGPTEGAATLDALQAASASNSAIKWAMTLIDRGDLDFGDPTTQAQIDALGAAGVITADAATKLRAAATAADDLTVGQVSDALNGAA